MIWTSCFWSDLRGMVNLSYMIFQCWLQGSNRFHISCVLWHRFGGGRIWRISWEELPLLARRDIPSMPGHATNDLPGVAVFPPPDELAPHGESARDHQQLICTICLDTGPKDWFCDPCIWPSLHLVQLWSEVSFWLSYKRTCFCLFIWLHGDLMPC
jgi:hypothetical protein